MGGGSSVHCHSDGHRPALPTQRGQARRGAAAPAHARVPVRADRFVHRGACARVEVAFAIVRTRPERGHNPGGVGPRGAEREDGWYGEPPSVVVTDSRPGRTDIEPGTPLLEHAGEGSRVVASLFRGPGWPCRRSRRDNWEEDLWVTRYPAFSAPSLRTPGGPWRGGWRAEAAGTRRRDTSHW